MAQDGQRAGARDGAPAVRTGAVPRTAGAVAALLLFWGALARSLWPEFAPLLLRVVGAARGAGGSSEVIETDHFQVRVASRAADHVVRGAVARLEADLAAIEAVVGDDSRSPNPISPIGGGDPNSPPVGGSWRGAMGSPLPASPNGGGDPGSPPIGGSWRGALGAPLPASPIGGRASGSPPIGGSWRGAVLRIPVTVVDGSGPALSDGQGLTLFHDAGRIDLSTAPFFLALLREGSLSVAGLRPSVDGGYAVWVAEEAGRAEALLGQSSDAWVVLLREAGTYVPLAEAWHVGVPRGEWEMVLALRALLEGGSFVRWVAETQGSEAVAALRDGVPVEEALGMSLAEAEERWLATLAGVEPRLCEEALPEGSPLRGYCRALVGER